MATGWNGMRRIYGWLTVCALLLMLGGLVAVGEDATPPEITLSNPDSYYVDGACQVTIPFSGYVTDDTCINADDVTVSRKCEVGVATYADWTVTKRQNGDKRVDIEGSVTLSDICDHVYYNAEFCIEVSATDCAGNNRLGGEDFYVYDYISPVVSFDAPPAQEFAADGTASIPLSGTITDNCHLYGWDLDLWSKTGARFTDYSSFTRVSDRERTIGGYVYVDNPSSCTATVGIQIYASGSCGGNSHSVSHTGQASDTAGPTINFDDPADVACDDTCQATITLDETVWDFSGVDKDDVWVTVRLTNCALVSKDITISDGFDDEVDVKGSITVGSISGSPAAVWIEIEAADACGNDASVSQLVEITESKDPLISFSDPLDVTVNSNCEAQISVSATVVDECGLRAHDVDVTITPPGNATVVDSTTATQTSDTLVTISGTVDVSDLTSSPATVGIKIDAEDHFGNSPAAVSHTVNVTDTGPPVISFPDPVDVSMDTSCEAVIPISATVTDNCRVRSEDVEVLLTETNLSVKSDDTTIAQGADDTEVIVGGSITVESLTDCPASLSIEITATDRCGQAATPVTQSVGVSDTTAPEISFPDPADATVDSDCEASIEVSAAIADNCCVAAGDVTVTVTPVNVSVKSNSVASAQGATNDVVNVSGIVVMEELTGCPAWLEIKIDADDECGNAAIMVTRTVNIDDDEAPVISFPDPADVVVDGDCQATIPITGEVTDNCCVLPAGVTVTVTPTNVSILSNDITKTPGTTDNTVILGGSITVEQLTDCPASVEIRVDADDCCGGAPATPVTQTVSVDDDEDPQIVIDYLRPADGSGDVGSCCDDVMEFRARVTDNCCIDPDRILVDVTATHAQWADLSVEATPAAWSPGVDEITITGTYALRCVTQCPASTELTVTLAEDCCGNPGVAASVRETYSLIRDATPPTAYDDPRQDVVMDESAVIDPLVEVRRDDAGIYRLVLRENSPVRIDVLWNDDDNCTGKACLDSCCGGMRIDAIIDPPDYGTATIEVPEGNCSTRTQIRYAPYTGRIGPDQFTYRVVDACDNVSGEATVYLEVVPSLAMEDVYVIACSGEPTPFTLTAFDLWVDDEQPDEIPFTFAITGGPSHGVVIGDPSHVVYQPPSTVDVGGTSVPTLEFMEAASIELIYVSEPWYVGSDRIEIEFSDPFANVQTSRVDIRVGACASGEDELPQIAVTQGDVLPIILPEGFASSVQLTDMENGVEYSAALTIRYSETVNRNLITIDSASLPIGSHLLAISLGSGEAVALVIRVEGE